MYEYIKGTCTGVEADALIIEASGIGYRIHWAGSCPYRLGEQVQIPLYFQVREDCQELFGFASVEHRRIFLMLLEVQGIGPKVAMQILGTLAPEALATAILNRDVPALTRVKGLGKKGAERIVVELKDKLKKMGGLASSENPEDEIILNTQGVQEVLEALLVLGFGQAEARKRLERSYDETLTLEENIRQALQGMDRG